MRIALTLSAFALSALLLRAADDAPAGGIQINLSSPLNYQVVQRTLRTEGKLTITGSVLSPAKDAPLPDALEVRLMGKSSGADLPAQWQSLPYDPRVASFRSSIAAPAGGWYRLEVRMLRNGAPMATNVIEHVGVGEIFLIAGQSNSANYGEEKQKPQTGLVSAFDGVAWRIADDPQPGGGGTKGSFVPSFGDAMVEQFQVPIGIVAMGIGSTSVREWLPAGTRMENLPTITRNVVTVGPDQWEATGKIFSNLTARMKQLGPHGFRAVLWHQGESDANQTPTDRTLSGALYHQYLEKIIRDSRREIGWDAPWFVAQVSYHRPDDAASPDIRAAQKALWDSGGALEGPDTDTLTGDMREKNGTGIHLSAKGQREHGKLWAARVGPWLDNVFITPGVK